MPAGIFKFVENLKEIGLSATYEWSFKTYPVAELISYELDSAPFTDPQLLHVNRRSNIRLTFGRKVYTTIADNQLATMTPGTHPSTLGISSTPPSGSRARLYTKINNQLVEEIDFSQTFNTDRVGVQYNSSSGLFTINFTHSFDCDTEYYLLLYGLVSDNYWEQSVSNTTSTTAIAWRTDGIRICHIGHDKDLTNGFFTIGFDRAVSQAHGALRIIDDVTGEIINEIQANDWNLVEYNQMSSNGLVYDYIRDDRN